mgnify:CR=1 FL=1
MNKKSIGYGFKKYYTDDALDKYDQSQSNKFMGNLYRSFLFCGLNIFIFTLYFIYIKYDNQMKLINNEKSKENKNKLINQLLTNILYYFIINIAIFILFNFLFSMEHNKSHLLISFGKFFNYFKTHIYLFIFLVIVYISLFSSLSFTNFYFNIFNDNNNLKQILLIIFNIIAFIQFILYLFIIFYTMVYSHSYKPIFFAQNFKRFFKK